MKIENEDGYIRAAGIVLSLCKKERTPKEQQTYVDLWHSVSEYEEEQFNMSALLEIMNERHLYGPVPGDREYSEPLSLPEWEWNVCRLVDRAHYIACTNQNID